MKLKIIENETKCLSTNKILFFSNATSLLKFLAQRIVLDDRQKIKLQKNNLIQVGNFQENLMYTRI